MITTNKETKIPRNVFTLHVLFSLIAVTTLLTGLTLLNENMRTESFHNNCHLRVNKSHSKLLVSKLCNGNTDLQSLTETINRHQKFDFCAIVDTHGNFLTHSQPHLVGKPYKEPIGERSAIAGLEQVSYSANDTKMRQYSLDLVANNRVFGEFKVGIVDNSSHQLLLRMLYRLPAVLLLPILAVFLGGFYIRKQLEPTEEILDQLENLTGTRDLSTANLSDVIPNSVAALGWNRLMDEIEKVSLNGNVVDQITAALDKQESKNEARILETLPYGVAETDIQGRITLINQAMTALLGMDEADAIGTRLDQHLELEKDSAPFQQLFAENAYNRAGDTELSRTTQNGERVLRVSRQPIRVADTSKPTKQVWSARDVTQLKLADKARDKFLDSATHEIRTPLANIKAYAETIAMNDINDVEQQKEFCNVINSEATRLSRFIDDLLDVSSLEAGSLIVRRQKIELKRLIEDVVSKVSSSIEAKSIEFVQQIDLKLPEIVVDKDKFTTCLINLLGNAIKYTPDGGQVTFSVRAAEKNLIIEVEDNGVGISADDLPKVFDKFFRSEDHRVLEESGTGLGLAFTKEVVRLHGGNVAATSQLNEGSLFTITLPVE